MPNLVYEASVYSRTVTYKNFNGETNTVKLFFAIDPLELMGVFAKFEPKKSKSGNPALKNQAEPMSTEDMLQLVRDLACKAAGIPSDDGETWEPEYGFSDKLYGKAFLTKLTASDADRREFSQKVILDPFRAFVQFAEAEPDNTPQEVQGFRTMLNQMENLFKMPDPSAESLEDRRARLAAEMAALDEAGSDAVPPAES